MQWGSFGTPGSARANPHVRYCSRRPVHVPIPPLTHSSAHSPPRRLRRVVLLALSPCRPRAFGVASVDLGEAAGSLSGADLRLMALAVVLFAACQSVSGLQWWVCQRAGGIRGLGAAHTLGLTGSRARVRPCWPASARACVSRWSAAIHTAEAEPGGSSGARRYKIVDAVVGAAAVLAIFMLTPPPGPAETFAGWRSPRRVSLPSCS